MSTFVRRSTFFLALAMCCAIGGGAQAHDHEWSADRGNAIVSVGHDSYLPAGERAQSVVAVLGSASSDGDAGNVVSVLGNTRVTGAVDQNAVSVLGNTYVDSSVSGNAVAVLGNVVLGPDADIGGNVVAIGGTVQRDPSALVHGESRMVFGNYIGFDWLHPWVRHCLLLGRPLALTPGIGWAWAMALAFLALYLLFALAFRSSVVHCAQTLESHPGQCIVAALLTVLLSPILLTLLCITVIGIAAVPFVLLAVFCAGLFGKAVMLAWLGRQCLGRHETGALGHPALAVLVGGVIVMALYLVPVLGFLVYKLLGLIGLGVVVFTLLQAARAQRTLAAATPAAPESPPEPPPPPAPAPPASPVINAAHPRAGFWVRMVALLLDALLIGIVMGLLHHLFNLELLVLAAYGAVMWKLRGSTIGGIVFDLQVVRLDGRDIDWATAIVRALACFLSLAVAGLGFIWIAFDHNKQAWHDKIAGTVVVRTAKGISLV
jgi:uncharacterized RDD family membrane protein YckC